MVRILKNNNNNRLLGCAGFGYLLGIWSSIGIALYFSVDTLIALGIFGGAICFLGFAYYWSKTNNYREKIKGDEKADSGEKTLLDKAMVWKK